MSPTIVIFMLATVAVSVSSQRRPPNFSLDFMPNTGFTCADKVIGGYYADAEAQCQMFHLCIKVAGEIQDFRFLCPNDTSFDQENQICDDWYNIDCEADLLRDKVDLYRVGFDSSKVATATNRTPIPVGPSSVKPVPSFTRQKTFQGGNSIDEDDNFQRSDTGDRRLQSEFLRGSSSSNFYSNRNGKDDYLDDPVIITKDDVSKVSSDYEKKKNNKATVRKLLTGKRPIGQAANSLGNEQPVEQTPKYQNLYRKQTTVALNTTPTPTQTTTSQPTESTTQYVRPKNSNLRFRGSLSYNGQQKVSAINDATSSNLATATQPAVDYYKKTSVKSSYNKNNFYSQTQPAQQVTQQQNYNNQQQQQTNNANSQNQAQVAYNNGNQQVFKANNQAITANEQFYNANHQYNANQQSLVNGINQQAYNVNNLQTTTQQQQNYNTQQYNNGPTQVPLDYFKKTSVKQSAYRQAETAPQTQNTRTNPQFTQKQTTFDQNEYYRTSTQTPPSTQNFNEFYRTSTNTPPASNNFNEYYRTSTNTPLSTNNFNEYYRTSTNTPPSTNNFNEYYRTSTNTPPSTNNFNEFYRTSTKNVPSTDNFNEFYRTSTKNAASSNNFNDFYKSSTTSPSSTFDYNEYYRTSAAALPSSTANYYDPYNSYKEQFLANNAYEEDVQDEFLKTAPSNNLRPSEINAFSKAYNKPVAFNASLTAKLSFNTKAETTLKPLKEKTAAPTQQPNYSPKQKTQTSVSQTVSQQTAAVQKPAETPAPAVQQTAQSTQPKGTSKSPSLSLEEYKKILEKPSDYDYAYYDGGDPNRDYDGVERIPEEFSKTKNIKKA